MDKLKLGWINPRYLIFMIYMLTLAFTLHLIYINSRITAKPRFKVENYNESYARDYPFFESMLIPQPAYLASSHSASFDILNNGDLLAVWFAGSHEGNPDVQIWSSRFNGQQWTPAKTVVSPENLSVNLCQFIHKVGNPVIYKAANGVLHLFVVSVGAIGGWAGSNIDHLQSIDDGRSWGKAQKLILSPLFNISTLARTRAVPLEEGGFYLPVYHETFFTYPELLRFNAKGEFIQKIRMTSKHGMLQPAILATTWTSGYAFLRNKSHEDNILYMQIAKKGGLSWSAPIATNMTNRDSSIAVIALDNHRLLMVHNPIDRSELVLSVSDNGRIWRDVMVLENTPNQEYSYPSIQIHDGIIDILYTYNRKKIKHVRFNLTWLNNLDIKKDAV